jgi:hypothetical protein
MNAGKTKSTVHARASVEVIVRIKTAAAHRLNQRRQSSTDENSTPSTEASTIVTVRRPEHIGQTHVLLALSLEPRERL